MEGTTRPASVSATGLILAAVFFTMSLTPSMMPRDALMQGLFGGAVAAIGYAIGVMLDLGWRALELPRAGAETRRWLLLGSLPVVAVIIGLGLGLAPAWQDATRAAVGLEPTEHGRRAVIALVALPVFGGLWGIGRLSSAGARWLQSLVRPVVPPRVAAILGIGATLVVVVMLVEGVLWRGLLGVTDRSLEAADMFVDPDLARPEDPTKTGSDQSLLDWQELGRRGREFVATAPTADEIAAFYGEGARQPVRVYVGRRSADTSRERAALALRELIRAGGFERSTLIVTVPTGTGWMDPGAHDTIDFMLGGDVATVAVQYSYLSSPLALAVHPEYGVEQARDLFEVVYEHWSELPDDARPRFYVFGLSQGAYNSQRTLPLLDLLAEPIHGALWTGSPFMSPAWQRVREARAPDSPAWRPSFGNGSLVRAMTQNGEMDPAESPWGPIRLLFLNYGSDPIVVFNWGSAWRRPDWLRDIRAPDVSPALRWFPVVTMFQTGLDMAVGLQVEGYGHYYVAPDYIDAWATLMEPAGWTPARAAELKRLFEMRAPSA